VKPVIEISQVQRVIISNEQVNLTRVWNHRIKVDPIDDQSILYTDAIEIEAGLFTVPIWFFTYIFYQHRQRKWKK
jgi:hypothetical protein